jgi:hypothetical protein
MIVDYYLNSFGAIALFFIFVGEGSQKTTRELKMNISI